VNRPIAWFATNSVAANLLMLFIVLAGLTTLPTIPQKPFPDVDIDVISVTVEYLGAAPEEVESGVCTRIEEEVEGVEGIEQIRSTAVEGVCNVSIELLTGTDVDRALDDVKNRVDAIDAFPEEAEKPIVSQITMVRPVIDVAVSGISDERALKELGQRVRDEIARMPGISQVELTLARPYEMSVEGGAPLVPGPARWLHRDRGRRDPAAHEGPGLLGRRVREARGAHATGWNASAPRERRQRARQLRGHRTGGPLRRRAGRDGARLPGRRGGRPRHLRVGQALRRPGARQPSSGRRAHGMA
jgi:hypothetical protein